MKYHPSHIDYALALVIIVLMAIEVIVFWGYCRAARRRKPRASRFPAYAYLIVYQWASVGLIAALWISRNRPWSALLLGRPHFWGFAVGIALAVAQLVLSLLQRRAIFKRPALIERVRLRIREFEPIAPHTPGELRVWYLTALTAGCCEEVIFRGFLLALAAKLVGVVAAVAITVVMFGLFHAYYGLMGILKTAALGLFFALVALWSASLIPVVVIHTLIDEMSGDFAYRVIATPAK